MESSRPAWLQSKTLSHSYLKKIKKGSGDKSPEFEETLARDSVPVEMAQQKRQNFGMAAVTESPSVQLLGVRRGGGLCPCMGLSIACPLSLRVHSTVKYVQLLNG
jgi:hypothetical protein